MLITNRSYLILGLGICLLVLILSFFGGFFVVCLVGWFFGGVCFVFWVLGFFGGGGGLFLFLF